jgi:hypothetical protein
MELVTCYPHSTSCSVLSQNPSTSAPASLPLSPSIINYYCLAVLEFELLLARQLVYHLRHTLAPHPFFFLVAMGFELRALHLLGRSTLVVFEIVSHLCLGEPGPRSYFILFQ